jgi:hypothetical protein
MRPLEDEKRFQKKADANAVLDRESRNMKGQTARITVWPF